MAISGTTLLLNTSEYALATEYQAAYIATQGSLSSAEYTADLYCTKKRAEELGCEVSSPCDEWNDDRIVLLSSLSMATSGEEEDAVEYFGSFRFTWNAKTSAATGYLGVDLVLYDSTEAKAYSELSILKAKNNKLTETVYNMSTTTPISIDIGIQPIASHKCKYLLVGFSGDDSAEETANYIYSLTDETLISDISYINDVLVADYGGTHIASGIMTLTESESDSVLINIGELSYLDMDSTFSNTFDNFVFYTYIYAS